MLPLLALGLLGGAGWLNQRAYDDRKQAGADKVQSLLGSAPREMGPPTEEGTMGQMPGQGLLGNMQDPATQAQFMQGLLTLPKAQAEQASRMYSDLFGRVQQAGQFDRSQKQQAGQFDRSQAQQESHFNRSEQTAGDRFMQEMGLRREQFTTGRDEWQKTFDANRAAEAQRNAIAQGHLTLAQQQANAKGAGGAPELPKGWMYTQSAQGPVAMPVPGTKDYADVTATERSLVDAQSNINRFLDVFAGKEQSDLGGARVGGSGTTRMGEKSSELATLRGKVVADIAVLRNMGVLQPGELKNLEKQLTDPTTWGSVFSTDRGTVKAYETLRGQFAQKLTAHRQSNPWLLPPPPDGASVDGAAPRPPGTPSRPGGVGGAGAAAPYGGLLSMPGSRQ